MIADFLKSEEPLECHENNKSMIFRKHHGNCAVLRGRHQRRGHHCPAFVLVTALLMLALLAVMATGLLSLSAVTLRESMVASAGREARSNARMALQLAMAQLQEHAGADMAVTAGAGMAPAGSGASRWTGVWDPMPPADVAVPDYDKDARFRSWLVSTPRPNEARDPALPRKSRSELVPMLGPGTLGPDAPAADRVEVPTIPLPESRGGRGGAVAWWTGDESTKARIDLRNAVCIPTTRRVR